jgi:hypothetical protein
LQTAAAGFEGARQFLVVEHVAHDLNISFAHGGDWSEPRLTKRSG